ncbi:MAG: methyl-coenzyme M reductase subunit beta [Methanomassiliicoccales archaeon]|jgi:methyl-coenzyme M reductase beta subunit
MGAIKTSNVKSPPKGHTKLPEARIAKNSIKNGPSGIDKYKISLYSDRGELIEKDVPLRLLHPAVNPTIRKIAQTIKNTSTVDLAGIESILKKGELGGDHCKIPGRGFDIELVKNADNIASRMKRILSLSHGDDTKVEVMEGGKILLVQVPSDLSSIFTSHDGSRVAAAMTLGHAIMEEFDLPFWQVPTLKAALIGRYSSSVDFMGGKVHHLLKESTVLEGPGHAFRTIPVNHFAAITQKNAMNAAALAGTTELLGHIESGDCYGPYELYALLAYAFQSLNANNLVYSLVKDNRTGTVSDVANDLIERAAEDGVIQVKEILPSGYKLYSMRDPYLWNAYTCAGTLAAVMINVGASRAAQMVTSTMAYFNDALELRTGLPSADALKLHGVGVVWSFYSHSIYGGGGPGIFSGDNPVIRNSFVGLMIPCGAAAMALDAGTQMFSPEKTSSIVGKVFGKYPYMREPIKGIAESIRTKRMEVD